MRIVRDCAHSVPLTLPCRHCDRLLKTVLTECMHCTSMIETRTGEKGIQDAINQGWSVDGAGDLICRACNEARAEIVGDEDDGMCHGGPDCRCHCDECGEHMERCECEE